MKKDAPSPRALAVPSGRLTRIGKLGGMTAGIAGNMAVNGLSQLGQGQRPTVRNLLLTPRNIGRIAEQLAQMRGAAMKIGQLVSMDTGDVLPPELGQIMARLRNDAHFMPPAQLKQVLNSQWPAGWLSSFAKFDVHPIAAASIGQVHRAQLKDGRDLAIKVQYPGVAKSIDSDVANVGALLRMSGLMPKGFALTPYLEEARKQLHQETDYLREAAELARYGQLIADLPHFAVPAVHADWSTPNILAMSFLPGIPIEDLKDASQEVRDQVSSHLIDLTLAELFTFGVMQTDPNFANYLYDPDGAQIVLLDFGAAQDIDAKVAELYRRLIRAGLTDDSDQLTEVAYDIGFLAPDTAETHRAQIIDMIRITFKALLTDAVYDFSQDDLSRELQEKGGALAASGFVPPPVSIDVLLLQRKFGGMFLLAKKLGARLALRNKLAAYADA